MEPEKMTAKQAADYLGVSGKELKQLERDGKIEVVDRGRGLFGSKYVAASVREFKLDEIEAAFDEAARHAEKEAAAMDNGEKLDRTLAKGGIVNIEEVICGETADGVYPPCQLERGHDSDHYWPPTDTVITEAELGYPDPRDFDANDEGAALYEKAVRDFEGDTHLEPVKGCYSSDKECCGKPEACELAPEDEDVEAADERDDLIAQVMAVTDRAVVHAERTTERFDTLSSVTDEAIAVAARSIARFENMDPEVKAMDAVSRALGGLTNEQRFRVVQWAVDRFYIVEVSAEGPAPVE